MRNLKKFLALVLALMMAMSLMVTANAAVEDGNGQFSDSENVTDAFVEDITILNGMDIIKGFETGEFQPQTKVTRAQMAAFVYRIATGDAADARTHAYVGYNKFSDVKDTDWFAGYIGYCSNAGYIVGYPDGSFKPFANVTGYQALAMILRAMGYNEPGHNFTGTGWEVTVSSTATENKMLKNVDKTSYAATLKAAAPRELVAELVFQGLTTRTVVWTTAFGYQSYNYGGQSTTLGAKNYGLASARGVVVGNQATGEKVTKIGIAPMIKDNNGNDVRVGLGGYDNTNLYLEDNGRVTANSYLYNNAWYFNWDSGLDDFGHAVTVWYDSTSSAVNRTTYAVFDRSTKSAVVAIDDIATSSGALTLTATSGVGQYYLNDAAWDEGFSVYTNTFWNYSFGPTQARDYNVDPMAPWYDDDGNPHNTSWSASNDFESPVKTNNGIQWNESNDAYPMYLLISNSTYGANSLDLVISLDLTVTEIVQRNNTTGKFGVGVYNDNGLGTKYFDVEDQATIAPANYANILESALVGNSAKNLGDKVVAIEVTGTTGRINSADNNNPYMGNHTRNESGNYPNGTTATTSNYYYQLSKLTHVVPGTVVKIDSAKQDVYLSDGTILHQSVFAYAVDGTFKDASHINAPTVYSTYNFYLDDDGNYIFWEELKNNNTFVYGTYLDYVTPTNSSEYTYSMVGVDVNGDLIIVPSVTEYTDLNSTVVAYPTAIKFNDTAKEGYSNNPLPKRDSNINSGFVAEGQYVGYAVSGGTLKAVGPAANQTHDTGFKQASAADFANTTNHTGVYDTLNNLVAITEKDVAVGAKTIVPTNNAAGEVGLFMTTNTKIYVVSGAGTSNQDVVKYNGIGELLKGNSAVYINGAGTVAGTRGSLASTDNGGASTYAEMIYFSEKPFQYAQSYQNSAYEIDTIFIPAEAIIPVPNTSGNMVFLGDSTPGLVNAIGEDAVQFTMYNNGVGNSYWIAGKIGDAFADSSVGKVQTLGDDVFYTLVATGNKAVDGGVIYNVAAITDAAAAKSIIGQYYSAESKTLKVANTTNVGIAEYKATTFSLQNAFIDDHDAYESDAAKLWNVGSAGVVNLNTRAYPGINNTLSDLNNAGSITSNTGVKVSCLLSGEGVVSLIYVNHNYGTV